MSESNRSGPKLSTEQERFWAGAFGDEYAERNSGARWLPANIALFSRILRTARQVSSVIEFGANIGLNLQAIRTLSPEARLAAVEINASAVSRLDQLGLDEVHHQSMLGFSPARTYDLVLSKGLLIHVEPDCLPLAYDAMFAAAGRYICLVEYYSPVPVEVPYRGYRSRLFKRDFAGELMDRFAELALVDYGFVYHRDPAFPLDDVTWFLLERRAR
ncbi:MAG: pseudaminic acid biosynthesis-associated methylase [Burkholderiales bacterium]